MLKLSMILSFSAYFQRISAKGLLESLSLLKLRNPSIQWKIKNFNPITAFFCKVTFKDFFSIHVTHWPKLQSIKGFQYRFKFEYNYWKVAVDSNHRTKSVIVFFCIWLDSAHPIIEQVRFRMNKTVILLQVVNCLS